jgi:hypothetical protein
VKSWVLALALTGCGSAFSTDLLDGEPHRDSASMGDAQESDHNVQNETGQDSSDSGLEAGRETGPDGPETGHEAGDSGPETGDTGPTCSKSLLWEQCLDKSCVYAVYQPAHECSCDYTCACLEALPSSELPSGCHGIDFATCSINATTGYMTAMCN